MTKSVSWLAKVAGLSLILTAGSVQFAEAHTADDYYRFEWPNNATEHWVFDNNVPTGFHDDITYGLGRWDNGAGGDGPNFIYDEVITTTNDFNPCTGARSKVFVNENLAAELGQADESILGYSPVCLNNQPQGSTIVQFSITLERTADAAPATGWYSGTGSPSGNQWDLRSIASHESGHSTGFHGHFTGPVTCPVPLIPGTYETMCVGSAALRGTTVLRTLEPHDLHTYEGAY